MEAVEDEEKKDINLMLRQLEEKKKSQTKEYDKIIRLHHMSMREIIFNIEELEEITKKKVDNEILLELL